MKVRLLVLLIVLVVAVHVLCSCGRSSKSVVRGLNEPFGEPQRQQKATKSAGSVHVSVWDGSSEAESPHIKGQVALVNAIMTFGHYWGDVLQDTKAGQEQIQPLVYSDMSINSISHMSVPRTLSPTTKVRYVIGSLPQAEVYEFQIPIVVGSMTHRLGEKLTTGPQKQADQQRYITELICRPDVMPVISMDNRTIFLEYIRDYIKTNVEPFMKSTEQKTIPYTEDQPLFQFQFIE